MTGRDVETIYEALRHCLIEGYPPTDLCPGCLTVVAHDGAVRLGLAWIDGNGMWRCADCGSLLPAIK